MSRTWDVASSILASTLRKWRGTNSSKCTVAPEKLIEFYDREGCGRCRLVREALTELNLDAQIYPVPSQGSRFRQQLKDVSGAEVIPFLYDPNTEKKVTGAGAIVKYLFSEYLSKEPPQALEENSVNLSRSEWASRVRGDHGVYAVPSKQPEAMLELFSFESSPYSRLVRERLSELEIPYIVRQLGKQQRADMGPSNFRMHLGPYKPIPGTRRESFFKQYGNVQVPFLKDQNTGSELFESADILVYLDKTYAA